MYKTLLIVQTTKDISNVESVSEILNICSNCFESQRFDHNIDLETPGRIFGRSTNDLSDSETGNDILRFGFPNDDLPRLWIHAVRLFGAAANKSINSDGYVLNDVRLSFSRKETLDKRFTTKLVALAKKLSNFLDASICYLATAGIDNYSYLTKSGLGVGLRDVYWLMIFGKEFLDMPGFSDSITQNTFASEYLSNGKIMARITATYFDVYDKDYSSVKDNIKKMIGLEYFCDEGKVVPESSGEVGLFSFLKERYLKEREFLFEKHASKVRPSFDYSSIYLLD